MLQRFGVGMFLAAVLLTAPAGVHAQSKPYRGPTDEAGDNGAERVGVMNGNRILLRFNNRVSLGGWPEPNESLWPNDDTGLNTLDEFNLIIGNMVFLANDSIPVTDENEIRTRRDLDTLWYTQSSSMLPGFEDRNPQGTVAWAFEPVFGYFNKGGGGYPAMSNHKESWPPDGWPIEGLQKDWAGEWKGRYGRGKVTAELEAYWAANDAQDQENLQQLSKVRFYPRPGVKIGDIHPEDVTVQKGMPWGGLGLRVEVRSYQWNNLQARDAIFFEYAIANISDYDLARAVFGFYLDAGNGNKAPNIAAADQIGYFDKLQDLAYTWSMGEVGFGGGRPPISGWAFLESPGVGTDGIDNDDDGLVDETRDNVAIGMIDATAGIADLQKFLAFYNLKPNQLRPHWDADEDQDWRDGTDENGNGVYDPWEDCGDDVGNDGVSPLDINYKGPDPDGSECNHRPDFDESHSSGEPNFGLLDVSESDMLGLTSFHMFNHPQYGAPQIKYDKECYNVLADDTLMEFYGTPSNLYSAFGSGTFRFPKGRTERLSMAQVNSYEELSGLNSPGHAAPSLYVKKRVVQGIYETDYRFAGAPFTPTLRAHAGDGRVYLEWNDVADRFTREPLLQGKNDFEGYKLYRSTDKHFRDAEVLYDAYGNPAGKKPIFQCDVKDSITGTPPHTYFNGLGYYLGDDSGLQHFFVDQNVQNGRTYYYAIVAYDFGITDSGSLGVNIPPTENAIVIDLDENENINYTSVNVQVVTPTTAAAGFTAGVTMSDPENLQSDAAVTPELFNLERTKRGNSYTLKFDTYEVDHYGSGSNRIARDRFLTTTGYSLFNTSEGRKQVYHEDFSTPIGDNWVTGSLERPKMVPIEYWRPNSGKGMRSEVVEGLQLAIKPNAPAPVLDRSQTGWVTGHAPIDLQPDAYAAQFFAYNYDIIFDGQPYTTKTTIITLGYPVKDVSETKIPPSHVLKTTFPFCVVNKSVPPDSTGNFEKLDLLVQDVDSNGVYDPGVDYVLAGYNGNVGSQKFFYATIFGFRFTGAERPATGDVYRVHFTKALQDSLTFIVQVDELNAAAIKTGMGNINVVPNPYIVTNTMEPAVNQPGFSQQRKLMFTHIPAQSTIKIFTSSGIFVRELVVENAPSDGAVRWDLLTKEGLEIAAGVYVYLVESTVTGDKKVGKFAVIK